MVVLCCILCLFILHCLLLVGCFCCLSVFLYCLFVCLFPCDLLVDSLFFSSAVAADKFSFVCFCWLFVQLPLSKLLIVIVQSEIVTHDLCCRITSKTTTNNLLASVKTRTEAHVSLLLSLLFSLLLVLVLSLLSWTFL